MTNPDKKQICDEIRGQIDYLEKQVYLILEMLRNTNSRIRTIAEMEEAEKELSEHEKMDMQSIDYLEIAKDIVRRR